MTEEKFDSIEFNNSTLSESSVGALMFDRYLLDKGFEVKGIRNAYHPYSVFFNRKTNQYLSINFGLGLGESKINFYIENFGFFHVPSTEEDIALFEKGELTPITL